MSTFQMQFRRFRFPGRACRDSVYCTPAISSVPGCPALVYPCSCIFSHRQLAPCPDSRASHNILLAFAMRPRGPFALLHRNYQSFLFSEFRLEAIRLIAFVCCPFRRDNKSPGKIARKPWKLKTISGFMRPSRVHRRAAFLFFRNQFPLFARLARDSYFLPQIPSLKS